MVIVLVALGLAASGCGGGRPGQARLTPADAERYVLVRETVDNLTRVLAFISTADGTVNRLAVAKPGSVEARTLAHGADLGWNNVGVELNNFTTREAAAVPGLTAFVQNYRLLTTNWQHTVEVIAQHGGRAAAHQNLAHALLTNRRQELKVRPLLKQLASSAAHLICQLERAHHELASPADAAIACANAARLGARSSGG